MPFQNIIIFMMIIFVERDNELKIIKISFFLDFILHINPMARQIDIIVKLNFDYE